MRFIGATLAVIVMLAFTVAAGFEVIVALKHVFTVHPFKAVGNVILVGVYGVLAFFAYWIAKTILNKEGVGA